MGKILRSAATPEQRIGRALNALSQKVDKLQGKRATLVVISGTGQSFILGDQDGSMWIDRDDHTLHYIVNGAEYKLTGTLV